jgi:aspartyl-tRNA(Asn)/glutamyl-tRNA(Gln) amidotransferase subunit A
MTATPAPEFTSLSEIASAVSSGRLSARAFLSQSLERIRELEGDLHCFNEVTTEKAMADADEVDRKVRAGLDPGPLAGVPVALKDNLCTEGIATTSARRGSSKDGCLLMTRRS